MKIHSMKLAQALPNQTSLILFTEPTDSRTTVYDIEMVDRGYFKVTDTKNGDTYLVFSTNVVYAKLQKEETEKKKPGRPAKEA